MYSVIMTSGSALFLAITAIVWCCILTDTDMIFARYRLLIDSLPSYLYKPLGGCAVCFSGQLSFWIMLISYHDDRYFDIKESIVVVILTLFFTDIIEKKFYA